MRSRWTRVFEEDGEKPDRRRDGEFVDTLATRAELVRRWEEGWQYLLGFLGSIGEPDLARTVRVRGNEVPLAASLVRQLGHYAYHVGQMVYRAKAFRGPDWVSLTIPRGESERYLGKGPGSAGGSAESSPGLSR